MSFAVSANILLLNHLLTSRERGIDYAPDNGGPHTIYIADMMRRQAQAWAVDRTEAFNEGRAVDGGAMWRECMQLVDERVRAYVGKLAKVAA